MARPQREPHPFVCPTHKTRLTVRYGMRAGSTYKRRRECVTCGHRTTTYEVEMDPKRLYRKNFAEHEREMRFRLDTIELTLVKMRKALDTMREIWTTPIK